MRRMVVICSMATLATMAASCACTDVGCQSSLQLLIGAGAKTSLPAGEYRVVLAASGLAVECSLELGGSASGSCTEAGPFEATLDVADGGLTLRLMRNDLDRLPDAVDVEIWRDGVALLSEPLTPAYRSFAPNGESCGPTCDNATLSLSID